MSDFKIVKLLDPIVLNLEGPNFTGAYDNGTTYNTGDSVSYNGSSYAALVSTTGNLPTDTTKWQLLASKGDPGGGITTGGTANQALTKIDGVDYNTQWSTIDKTFVGLGNVDNTADSLKPVSGPQATAIGVVQTDIDNHQLDFLNPHAVTKTQVGLSNVQNLDQTDPTNIVQDATHRFATDAEKTLWNSSSNNFENLEWELSRSIALNNYYKKLLYTLDDLTAVEIYEDNTETVLQYSKSLTYTMGDLTSVVITRAIDSATATKTLTYTLGNLTSVDYS